MLAAHESARPLNKPSIPLRGIFGIAYQRSLPPRDFRVSIHIHELNEGLYDEQDAGLTVSR